MRLTHLRRLRKLMVIQGVSQRQLAEAVGWRSHTSLGRVLRGQTDDVPDTIAANIANYLDVPVESLFASSRKTARRIQGNGAA